MNTKDKLREAAAKFQSQENDSLVIDFDAAVEEQKAKAIKVKFGGDVYELPSKTPAWLVPFMSRNKNDEGVMEDEANFELIELLLGKEFANRIVDDKDNFVSFESVNNNIILPVMDQWGLTGDEGEQSKNGTSLDK